MTPAQWFLTIAVTTIYLLNLAVLFGLNGRITKMQRVLEQRGVL